MTVKATVIGPMMILDATDVLQDQDLDGVFDAFEQACRAGPFVVLTDTTELRSAPRQIISRFADRLKKMPEISKLWLGDAVVVKSAAVRFVLSTLLVIAPMPTEVKVFGNRIEARHWCAMLLRRHGLIVPDSIRAA